jgi:hypothetical protein
MAALQSTTRIPLPKSRTGNVINGLRGDGLDLQRSSRGRPTWYGDLPHQRRVSFTLFSSSYRARTAFAISAK